MRSLILLLGLSLYSALVFGQDCASISVTGGNQQITVSGLSGAPIATVQVFNASWASVFNQTYTNPAGSVVVPSLSAGQYFVNVRLYTSGWAQICEKGSNATVTNNPPPAGNVCGATFQKSIGTLGGNDESFDLAKAVGGGYFVAGYSAATGNTNHDALVIKLDNNGNVLWSKTFGGAQEDFITQVVPNADGGCVVAGATNSSGLHTFTGDGWVVRLDAAGNILWQKRYFSAGGATRISYMIATSDGGYAFTGTFPFAPGVSDWMIVKIDGNGNFLWQRKIGAGSSDSGNGIIEDDHGGAGLVVTGIQYGTTYYDAIISKLDLATGALLWTKAYDIDSRSNWLGPIHKVADGFVFDVLNADNFEQTNMKSGLLKTNFNGEIQWAKEFVVAGSREGELVVLPDGGFMVSQGQYPRDASTDVHMFRLDASANIIWSKRYPRAGAQHLWGLEYDNGYVTGVGMNVSGSYNDVLLTRTDLNGKMGSSCVSENFSVTTRNMSIAPLLNFSWPVNTALNLSAVNTTATATTRSLTTTVVCEDACPVVTVSNVTVNENAGNAILQVCLSAPAGSDLTYGYVTMGGTASGNDYADTDMGQVTIPAGQTCATISIPITNDTEVESDETFTVAIGFAEGTVTIKDDDQATNNCSDVTVTAGSNLITVTGVTAPVATVQVFNSSWATVFNQTYTNAPGTVNVNIGPGDYLVKVTFYTANWAYVCDKSVNVTVVNNCPAGTICISNYCPTQTVNLNDAYSIPNLPAGTVVSWHTGTPATDANKMTDAEAQAVSVSGTYYAAIHISGGCYSQTIPVTVTIVACSAPAQQMMVQSASDEKAVSATRNITAFPNPFKSSVRVVIDSEKSERATLVLMDVQGRPLKQMPVQLSPGSNTVLLEGLDRLSSGNYLLKVNTASGGMKTLKLMRQQ